MRFGIYYDIIKRLTVNTLTFYFNRKKVDLNLEQNQNLEAMTPTRDAREIIHKFIQTNRLHRRIIERYGDRVELNCAAHRMLYFISKDENLPSQKELAQRLKISPAAVANTLKKLETDGYVERCRAHDGCDCRANEISLTDKGRHALTDTEKYFRHVDTTALADFTQDELEELCRLLDKIQNNLHSIEDIPEID